MHIPSGFLTPAVWIPLDASAAGAVWYAVKKTGDVIDERKTPVMGVMAAFIFAAQMVNFPVMGGTSGHLMGSALAVATLGLWPGMVAMSAVVIMQALLFQDGGVEALGANIINMAVSGCLVSSAVIGLGKRLSRELRYFFLAFAGWLSVVAASLLCAVELVLSGTSPLLVVLPAMGGVHAVIGVFEGLVSVIALRFICSVSPGFGFFGEEEKPCGGS